MARLNALRSQAVASLRAADGDPKAIRHAIGEYVRAGFQANFVSGTLVAAFRLRSPYSPSVLDELQLSDADRANTEKLFYDILREFTT